MHNNIVNVAIQVLPSSKKVHPYNIVDRAIEVIQKTGLKYKVCPFETVIEGRLNEILEVVKEIHTICYNSGTETMMMYIKIQSAAEKDVCIEDKMSKYE